MHRVNARRARSPSRHRSDSVSRYGGPVTESRTVTVPVVVERDEDGVWCAHAQLRPGLGAHGEGDTEEAALQDLREALTGLVEEFGVPRELSITVAA
jgi:predicted RNase H-like HicB family nuclease